MGNNEKGAILIVDDEADACDFIKSFLEDREYTVFTALNGRTGIALIKNKKPALVFLDVKMPDISGIEVLEELKKDGISAKPSAKKEQMLDEVLTGYGKISKGMTVDEVEKILPITSRVFKYETRTGYKNITIYDFDKNSQSQLAGLWIELENDKVKNMRLVK